MVCLANVMHCLDVALTATAAIGWTTLQRLCAYLLPCVGMAI